MKPVLFLLGVLFLSAACSNAQSTEDDAALFARLDINEDGWLSGTELEEGRWTPFDRDGDGEVTREEFLAGRAGGATVDTPETVDTPAPVKEDAPAAATVPAGVYETYFFGYNYTLEKWLGGDIEIRQGGHYRFQGEAGRYRLDEASGQVIWEDGPLAGVHARYKPDSDGKPAIVLPRKENEEAGRKMAISDIWAYLRQADWVR